MSARATPGAKSSSSSATLRAVEPGSSSPTSARLRLSKGTALTPSYLSVNARSTGPVVLRWEYTSVEQSLLQEVGDVEVVVVEARLRGRGALRRRTLLTTEGTLGP